MSNFFHNRCNISDCMYKGVGGWEGGGVGVGGGWEAGGGLHRPTGLFGVAMSPRSASHRPRHDWRAFRDPSSALHGSHCLSHDFIHGWQNQL